MNEKTKLFKPDDLVITLGEDQFRLVYDLNAFCELEKIYDSVDTVLQMLLGTDAAPDLNQVRYNGALVIADEITIANIPLSMYISQINTKRTAKHADTLNLLWAGLLHDHAIYNEHEEITGYTISKTKLGSMVTFKNLRQINAQIVIALLRDLLPPGDESKNEEAPEEVPVDKTEA